MVLYTGRDTRIFQLNMKSSMFLRSQKYRVNQLNRFIDKLVLILVVFSIYASAFLLIYYTRDSNEKSRFDFVNNFVKSEPLFVTYLKILCIVSSIIPFYATSFQDLITFMVAYRVQNSKNFLLSPSARLPQEPGRL